jgi:transcription-repair coupling factor (superfamily II helicase)
MSRQGQVYYLHNRVMTIDRVKKRLQRILPEARIAVAHGQMPPSQLADVMKSFVQGDADLLLCTTIIESGLDIPNVNTIIIDRADRFGMADLYQLRGRVGRSTRKAYAYFLLPRIARIDPVARKRIATLKKYTELGSGFQLALRDLELRGAGNLLGIQQSGHIVAIGFVLYCQLLKRTIDGLRGKPTDPLIDVAVRLDFVDLSPSNADLDNSAVIPIDYIPIEAQRISSYRKIAEAGTAEGVESIRAELLDRYGRLPASTERLLCLARLRATAASRNITAIETRGEKIMLTRDNDFITAGGRLPRLTAKLADKKIGQIMHFVEHI